jgi:superfamily II DNA or RNA helicase
MITSSGAEGIDLKNVRYVHLMEPYWHPVRLEQVIGRARRICSHKDLPREKQTVQVFLYLLTHDPELLKQFDDSYRQLIESDTNTRDEQSYVPTTDEKLYMISDKKRQLMKRFHDALKVTSIDCMVNYEDKNKCFVLPSSKSKVARVIGIEGEDDKRQTVKTSKNKAKKVSVLNNDEL